MPSGATTAVEQARDVRVLECREDLPLHAQAALNLRREQPAAHDLQRDALLILLIGALREVHVAHAAGAELAHDAIAAEHLPFERFER